MAEMIAVCGLDCATCPGYQATQTNDLAKAQATAAAWSKQFGVSIPVDAVWCDGCLTGVKKCAHCAECEIRNCGQKRGVANCAYCADYPCDKLADFFKMAPMAKNNLDRLRP